MDYGILLTSIYHRNPLKGSKPLRTIAQKCLGIVGLAVDPTESGATFLCTSSIDSVIARLDMEGNQEGRVELGPGKFKIHYRNRL